MPSEPTLDEILESIRRIIAGDDCTDDEILARWQQIQDREPVAKKRVAAGGQIHNVVDFAYAPRARLSLVTDNIDSGRRRSNASDRLIFISYSSPDLKRALAFVHVFENAGLTCWIAPRNIPPGHNFNAEIVRAIDRCTDFVLLFSNNCNDSKHVKRELYLCQEQPIQKPIIPVRLDDAQLSDEFRYLLAGTQWATAADPNSLLPLFSGGATVT